MNRIVGILLIVVSAASFGTLAIFGRYAYENGIDTFTLLFLRFIFAALFMFALLASRHEAFPRGKPLLQLIGMGALGYVGQSFAYLSAIKYASAGLVALLLYLFEGKIQSYENPRPYTCDFGRGFHSHPGGRHLVWYLIRNLCSNDLFSLYHCRNGCLETSICCAILGSDLCLSWNRLWNPNCIQWCKSSPDNCRLGSHVRNYFHRYYYSSSHISCRIETYWPDERLHAFYF